MFPVLGNYIGTTAGPIAVMLAEHKIIRENYQRFHEAFSELNEVSDNVQQLFAGVANILRAHIMKEDNVLFPMASEALSEDEKDEIARQVASEKQN